MADFLLTLLILLAAIGSGLVAGTFFAFSTFVMPALGDVPGLGGIEAMQRINRVILRSPFIPVFLGTAAIALLLALWGILLLDVARAIVLSAAALLYVVGSVLLTLRRNVPLNTALDAVAAEDAGELWRDYLQRWTQWNHVRTLASVLAMVCFMLAL
ncbi:MAG: DUF1772 domain-containing protein [Reyranellaceae bacterium]